jgi:tRNA-(ms[2]io[6]A)-hydroxylase
MTKNDYINPLLFNTPSDWVEHVLANFDVFLQDHASAEKKASGMAITLISHYPDRHQLVNAMSELAVEELSHFREVIKIIHQRGGHLAADSKDLYVGAFRKHMRDGTSDYFMDRLLIAGIIEARGAERFGLVADAVEDPAIKQFYQAITRSEQRHFDTFIELARLYHPGQALELRLQQLLELEADICAKLPIQPALH